MATLSSVVTSRCCLDALWYSTAWNWKQCLEIMVLGQARPFCGDQKKAPGAGNEHALYPASRKSGLTKYGYLRLSRVCKKNLPVSNMNV